MMKSNWISVNDRLPDRILVSCIVCLKNKSVFEGVYSKRRGFWSIVNGDFEENNPVTHWMPLPEPPKQ